MELNHGLERKVVLPIEGMTCAACVSTVTNALERVDGVVDVVVNLATETALVTFGPGDKRIAQMGQAVSAAGYGVVFESAILAIPGLSDATPMKVIQDELERMDGVLWARGNVALEQIALGVVPGAVSVDDMRSVVATAGFEAASFSGVDGVDAEVDRLARSAELHRLRYLAVAAGLGAVSIMMMMLVPWFEQVLGNRSINVIALLLATPVQFWVGRQFYVSAFSALRHRTTNMNTLIAMGTSVAYAYSAVVTLLGGFASGSDATYFDTSTAIIALILAGRFLEARAKASASASLRALLQMQPKRALRLRDGQEQEVPSGELIPGDIVIIRPGETIPVDGVVQAGSTTMDESMLTGESMPVDKQIGSLVYGGSINAAGSVNVEATKVGSATSVARITRLVQEAQGSRAPIQRLADTFAAYFVPLVLTVALSTFLGWWLLGPESSPERAMLNAIAVLIIACPCAVGLATPTAIMVGTGSGASQGILIRGAEALEQARKVDTVVFDKTGTLTQGRPSVTDVLADGVAEEELLRLAASVESRSEHPLGRAIVQGAQTRRIVVEQPTDFQSVAGLGVRAKVGSGVITVCGMALARQAGIHLGPRMDSAAGLLTEEGKTPILVLRGDIVIGLIGIADTPRDESAGTIATLKRMGIEVAILSGDTHETTEAIASQLAVEQILAEVLPGDKVAEIKRLQDQGKMVAMVGDGVNDAPALAQANVGIAIGTGTDAALEVADISLMSGNLYSVVAALRLSKATIRTIKQNLAWAFGYNLLLIPVAAGLLHWVFGNGGVPEPWRWALGDSGFLSPMLAALAMAASSVSVITNSLRLRSWKGTP